MNLPPNVVPPDQLPPELLVARDYLLEHWSPEDPDTLVYLTNDHETAFRDKLLQTVLPHYARGKPGDWGYPRFSLRLAELLGEVGVTVALWCGDVLEKVTIRQTTLRNWS